MTAEIIQMQQQQFFVLRDIQIFEQLQVNSEEPVAIDTETYTDHGKTTGGLYGKVRFVQLYQRPWTKAIIIDCLFIDLELVLEKLKNCHLVFHNASYDLHTINCHSTSYWMPRKVDDTFYLAKTKYYQHRNFDFYSCLKYARLEDKTIRNIDKKANQKADWGGYIDDTMLLYAACDVLYLLPLYEDLAAAKDEIYEMDIRNLYYAVQYNRRGLPINQSKIAQIKREQMLKLEEAMKFIPVNINSSKQCKEWLGLPGSDADLLADAALNGNERASHLLHARKASKILNFAEKYSNPRMRSFHNPCGARTSRMTCSGGDRYWYDNLQQPPRSLYAAFEAEPGNKLVYADFSGLELRMVAAYVGEVVLEQLFKDGIDVHTRTGAFLYDCSEEELRETQRWSAKMVSFTTIYGGGSVTVQGIMQKQGGKKVDVLEVKQLQKKWLELYEYIKEWHKMHGKALQVYGFIDTVSLLGRKIRATTYTESFNFPIQSSGAEVLKRSLDYLHSHNEDPRIVNVVHDSITLEHPEGEQANLWGKRLEEAMQKGWRDVVQNSAIPDMPMKVDVVISNVMGVKDGTEYDYGVSEL